MAKQWSLFHPILNHSMLPTKLHSSTLHTGLQLNQHPLPQLISVLWLQSFCCGHLLKLIPVFCNHQPPLHWRQLPLWHLPCPLHTLLFSKWSALGTLWHHHHQFPPWVNWNTISAIPKQTLVCTVHYLTNPHSICMELVRTFSSVLMTNSFLILASWTRCEMKTEQEQEQYLGIRNKCWLASQTRVLREAVWWWRWMLFCCPTNAAGWWPWWTSTVWLCPIL